MKGSVSVKVSTGSAQIKGRTEPALPTSKFSGQNGRMAKNSQAESRTVRPCALRK